MGFNYYHYCSSLSTLGMPCCLFLRAIMKSHPDIQSTNYLRALWEMVLLHERQAERPSPWFPRACLSGCLMIKRIVNCRTSNLRKALHLFCRIYAGTQIATWTESLQESDILLQPLQRVNVTWASHSLGCLGSCLSEGDDGGVPFMALSCTKPNTKMCVRHVASGQGQPRNTM